MLQASTGIYKKIITFDHIEIVALISKKSF